MAKARTLKKSRRLALRTAERAKAREEKKKRQTKLLMLLAVIVIGIGLLLIAFLCGRGLYRALREKEASKDDSLSGIPDVLQKDPAELAGYWWYDETSFFCIEEGKYRSYYLSEDRSSYVLASEYKVTLAGGLLILSTEDGSEASAIIEYTLQDEGTRLDLHYTNAAGEAYIPSFTAGDPPTLPLRSSNAS